MLKKLAETSITIYSNNNIIIINKDIINFKQYKSKYQIISNNNMYNNMFILKDSEYGLSYNDKKAKELIA